MDEDGEIYAEEEVVAEQNDEALVETNWKRTMAGGSYIHNDDQHANQAPK
jgi:hypothetical protein